MANFWEELKSPFFVLAPMEDVTDTVFRQIIAAVAKPDVFFTEFANVDAICHNSPSDPSLNLREGRYTNPGLQRLLYSEIERPIVAQIWGTDPQKFFRAAQIVAGMGFNGIDINLGCPVRKIIKTGACAALIGQEKLVGKIITATKEGAGELPLSIKTRIGIKGPVIEDWIRFLLTQNLAAITIHGRTAAEKSEVPAHWDEIAKVVSIRNQSKAETLIIGNGDVTSILSAKHLALSIGVDGVMIGRGIFQNLAIFNPQIPSLNPQEMIKFYLRHVELFEKTWGKTKNFAILKKFAKTYISGFTGASGARKMLVATKNYDQLLDVLHLL